MVTHVIETIYCDQDYYLSHCSDSVFCPCEGGLAWLVM